MPVLDGGGPGGLPSAPSGLNTTQTILLLAGNLLQDQTGTKWGPDRLVPYLNLAILEIINLKPDAYTNTVDLTLVAGPIQKLPDSFIDMVDAICNLTVGDVPGRAIKQIEKTALDSLLPGWMTFPSNATVIHAVIDPREPKKLYVFPPQPAGQANAIRTLMTLSPSPLVETDDAFPLDDSYIAPAVDYLVYRALAEETTIPNAINKATMFLNKFYQDLGIKKSTGAQQEKKGT
jgi:hypothetical protein